MISVPLAQNTPALLPANRRAGVSGAKKGPNAHEDSRRITRLVWERWEWPGAPNPAGNSAVVSGMNTISLKVAKMNFLAALRDSDFGILKGGFSCITPVPQAKPLILFLYVFAPWRECLLTRMPP
jgi:hypothetical protein